MSNSNLSPMMKNYLQTKEQYHDCILLYRLGDFYEMFFEDAEKASKILDLTLTGKNCGLAERAPMCGVPYHAVDAYIAKLISAGEKVAICEQLSEPNGRGLVERDVVRVITAGTVMDSDILDDSRSNYICSVYGESKLGVAICDLTTGDAFVTEFDATGVKDFQEFIVSYKPSEVISNDTAKQMSANLDCVKAGYVPSFYPYDESYFEQRRAKEEISSCYKVSTLDGFGLQGKNCAIKALGALLQYLTDTQKRDLPHLKIPKFVDKSKYMSIDVKTRKNLELTVSYRESKRKGSLLWLLDKTDTSMGARLLADWIDRPLQKAAQINARLDGVEELYKSYMLRANLHETLRNVYDIERLVGKIAYNNVTPKDCVALKRSLALLPKIKSLLGDNVKSRILRAINEAISPLYEVTDLLERAIEDDAPQIVKDSDYIKHGFDRELDELFDLAEHGSARISALEEYEKTRTGIKNLKLGYNKVFGYYFEITNSMLHLAPENFIRKQTTTNGERFVSPELKELEEKMLTAFEKKVKLQKALFESVRNELLQYIPSMQSTAQAVASLDCLLSLANVAEANDYCKPKINAADNALVIKDGRHPIVEAYIKRDNFITNDVNLDTEENRTMIITGPNMAGKSTYMRQVALITLMAHIGSFVPAKFAEVPIVDKIFTRVGANDDLAFNQSTFMVEMVEVANILNKATKKSLIILDEVGRGTSTFDGLSIAWAVMEYVSQNICAKTLFSTHYHELTDLEGRVDGVKNYRITVKEFNGSVVFLHKIARGGANKSFGIEVASLAGVPQDVCARAKEIVALLENSNVNVNLDEITNDGARRERQFNKTAQEVSAILRDVDINKTSPIEAFDILNTLVKKVKENG